MPTTDAETRAMAQTLISDDKFSELVNEFMPELLQNSIGEDNFAPELAVITEAPPGKGHSWIVCKIMDDRFNESRHEILFGLGAKMYAEGHRVVAAILTSEAWQKSMTLEQEAQRDKRRAVSSYDDKQEVIIIIGMTLDGRCLANSLLVERDDKARFCGFPPAGPHKGVIHVKDTPIMDAFFMGFVSEMRSAKNAPH